MKQYKKRVMCKYKIGARVEKSISYIGLVIFRLNSSVQCGMNDDALLVVWVRGCLKCLMCGKVSGKGRERLFCDRSLTNVLRALSSLLSRKDGNRAQSHSLPQMILCARLLTFSSFELFFVFKQTNTSELYSIILWIQEYARSRLEKARHETKNCANV